MSTGTHIYSAKPLQQRLEDEFGDLTFEELPVRFQVCAASIERAAEHWFDSGPVVDAVVASAAVPGLLPPAKVGDEHFLDGGIVNSIPVGRAVAARRHPDLRAPGRPDRPAAEAAAPAVGGGAGVVRDRPPAPVRPGDGRAPRRRRGARAAGAGHVGHATTPCSRTATSPAIQERIDATYEASRGLPGGPVTPGDLGAAPARRGTRGHRCVTVLVWVTLPLWLIAAAALVAAAARAAARAAPALGGDPVPHHRGADAGRAARAVARVGVRLADADAVLRGHPLRPGAGRDVGVLPRGPAGAEPAASRPTARPPTPTPASRSSSAAGTPAPATRSR